MELRIYPYRNGNLYPYARPPKPSHTNHDNFFKEIVLTDNTKYGLMTVEGIDPCDTIINSSHLVGVNGERVNSSYLNSRTITITVAINSPAEQNRRELFDTCRIGNWLGMEFRLDDKILFISGMVKQIPTTYFDKKEVCQIIVYCPSPEFKRIANVEEPMRWCDIPINGDPVEIEVYGDLTTYPRFYGTVLYKNPPTWLQIEKNYLGGADGQQHMKINYSFHPEEFVEINCIPSERMMDGVTYSNSPQYEETITPLLPYLTNDSSWIKFDFPSYFGHNSTEYKKFRITMTDSTGISDEDYTFRMRFYDLYQGV